MKGLIVIGYTGIGKSSIAGQLNSIDLESGYFRNSASDDWEISYCELAMELANQGYTVLISSHREVVEFIKTVPLPKNVGGVVAFCPPLRWKDAWIGRLKKIFELTNLEKDYEALKRAEEKYEEDILALVNSGLPVIQPAWIDYDLEEYIRKAQRDYCGFK